MDNFVNLVKLSVGSDSVESLIDWQDSRKPLYQDGNPRHVTRMWPKREAEILNGGSIYWVIKGVIQCRQRVLRLDEVRGELADEIQRNAIEARVQELTAGAEITRKTVDDIDPAMLDDLSLLEN